MIASARHSTDEAAFDRISIARDQARLILQRLGWVLVGLFALDLIEEAFAWARHQSASLDFLPLIAGFIVMRGGLRPVRTIRFIAGMTMVAGFIMTIYAALAPTQLIVTELHLDDFSRVLNFITGCLYALVGLAIYRGACSEPVEIALRAAFGAPHWWNNPVVGPATGVLLSLLFVGLWTLAKPTFDIALSAARTKYGGNYQYVVTGWSSVNEDWNVDVDAYNADSIKKIDVEIAYGHVRKVTSLSYVGRPLGARLEYPRGGPSGDRAA